MKKLLYLFIAVSSTLFFASCAEDGEPGPAGTDGVDGTNGTDGVDGENGEGFDELTKDGNVIIYLDGTRPDGVAFKDTVDFKYSNGIPSVVFNDDEEGEEASSNVSIIKFSNPTPFFEEGGTFEMEFRTPSLDSDEGFDYIGVGFSAVITTDDLKVFFTQANAQDDDEESGLAITDYSYDANTGNLNLKFTFTSPADENSTEHELSVSGEANVILYEVLESEIGPS